MFFKFISFIIFILLLIFIFQNLGEVTVDFLNISFTGPLALSITIAVISGFLLGTLITIPSSIRRSAEVKKLKKELSEINDRTDISTGIEFNQGSETPADLEA